MKISKAYSLMGCVALLVSSGCSQDPSFAKDINPLLQANCMPCHTLGGEGEVASGLNMDHYASLMKGTKFGSVIEPGSPINSTLVLLLEGKGHSSINMPKEGRELSQAQLNLVRTWIDQGAKNN